MPAHTAERNQGQKFSRRGASAPKTAPKKSEGLVLEYVETFLLKFSVRSKMEVPAGLEERIRSSQSELDKKHIIEAQNEGLNQKRLMRGRIRPGHVDTGFPVYNEVVRTSLRNFCEGAIRQGYNIRDGHYFTQSGKFIIVYAFHFAQLPGPNADELLAQIAELAEESWTVSLWDNPTLVSTANCTYRSRHEPTFKLVVGQKTARIVDL